MGEEDARIGFLGERARLAEAPSERLAAAAFAYELEAAPWLWRELSIADLAHTRELVEAGVIDEATGVRLLTALLQVHDLDETDVRLDPMVGDLYSNRDKLLRDRFGADVGRIHTGRARREATTLGWHMRVRRMLIDLLNTTTELLTALVSLADEHRTTLMPDFTYLQHAHPTTLGHYLLGFAYPVARDVERLGAALALVNQSPAGSGSVNGSRFPIDRHRMARALGFDGVVTHTRDAMWAPDRPLTVMAGVLATMTTVDRLTEELQLWATVEFGFVTLADRHCRTSVIMPQKKNPYSLAMIRGHARAVIGELAAVAVTNLTPSGQPDNRAASYVRVPVTLHSAIASTGLLAEVLTELAFDEVRMAEQASIGYAYATDLCDYLVLQTGIDNRSAHRIVGLAVRHAIEAGAEDLDADGLTRAAKSLDLPLDGIDEEAIASERDLRRLLQLRSGVGGAADLDAMLEELRRTVSESVERYSAHPILDFEERFLNETRRFVEVLA